MPYGQTEFIRVQSVMAYYISHRPSNIFLRTNKKKTVVRALAAAAN